ncbi:MAG: ribosome recycling factor [Clostridia bacterium]
MKEQLNKISDRMEKSILALVNEFGSIRAGRANAGVLNKISVDYYGTPTPISQIAGITIPEPRLLVIQPYDVSLLKEIEKEIQKSDLGLNPSNDGKIIRINFPSLTEERRKELVKQIKKTGEEAKIGIRNIRRDGMDEFKKMKKDSLITEDELANSEKDLQKITDKFCKEIDDLVSAKEKEVLSV